MKVWILPAVALLLSLPAASNARADDTASVTAPLAVGGNHVCAITDKRKVICFGSNRRGQLGNAMRSNAAQGPSEVFAIENANAVAAGYEHSCAVIADGKVKCWGSNSENQLGAGTAFEAARFMVVPLIVEGLPPAVSVALGGSHSCALTAHGEVHCWGGNDDGQLGAGILQQSSPVPVRVSHLSGITQIAAGLSHTCALAGSGEVYCWGRGTYHTLGSARTSNASEPVKVPISRIRALAAGSYHTCARDDSDTTFCWGSSEVGRLGHPLIASSSAGPQEVYGSQGFTALALGQNHSCAIGNDGSVKCWGDGQSGQLGNGEAADAYLPVPSAIRSAEFIASGGTRTCAVLAGGRLSCWGNGKLSPELVRLPERIFSNDSASTSGPLTIGAGTDFSCGIFDSGKVACWGSGDMSTLGTASSPVPRSPPIWVAGIEGASGITTGHTHTCAILADSTVSCWGIDGTGRMTSPTQIAGIRHAVEVSSLVLHTCALDERGAVYCWGRNSHGETGVPASDSPVAAGTSVTLPGPAISISAGHHHSCAVIQNGDVYCWGANTNHQLNGKATPSASHVPQKVDGIGAAVAVAASEKHTCALLDDSTVWCWGEPDSGRLGSGLAGNSHDPVMTSGLTDVVDISAGRMHTCALRRDQTVWCWGSNEFQQLGRSGVSAMNVPAEVFGVAGAVRISSGYAATFAILADGTVKAWGYNFSANLATKFQSHPSPVDDCVLPSPLLMPTPGHSARPVRSAGSTGSTTSTAEPVPGPTESEPAPNPSEGSPDRYDDEF